MMSQVEIEIEVAVEVDGDDVRNSEPVRIRKYFVKLHPRRHKYPKTQLLALVHLH